MSALRYDGKGLSARRIGEDVGISAAEEREVQAAVSQALEEVRARHDRGELGFMDCPDADFAPIVEWANLRRQEEWTDQVVIGIGGSSLGTRAILDASRGLGLDGLRTHFLENVDPMGAHRLLNSLPLETTLFVVVTKSGTTIETMGNFWIARERMVQAVGQENLARHFVAVTDPQKGSLRALVNELGLDSFEVPPNVGGRFSVLTPVGLVPLALAGYPLDLLLEGARRVKQALAGEGAADHPVLLSAAHHYLLYRRGFDQLVMMAYSDELLGLVDWFRQLWAESLGKATNRQGEKVFTGVTPIKAWGAIDQHSQVQLYMEGPNDKHILFLAVEQWDDDPLIPSTPPLPDNLAHLSGKHLSELLRAELDGTQAALGNAGRPTSRWTFTAVAPLSVGAFMFSWEMITALMGELLEIDAFDQPGVELGKKIAHGLLGRPGFEEFADLAKSQVSSGNAPEQGQVVI